MLKITLKIDDEDKVYEQHFVSGRAFRDTVTMQEKMQTAGEEQSFKNIDEMASYVVRLFGNQFTTDQYFDGIGIEEVLSTPINLINEVIGRSTAALPKPDPNK